MNPDAVCIKALNKNYVSVDTVNGLVRCNRGNWPGRVAGTKTKIGYMVLSIRLGNLRKQVKIHRLVWIAANGPIPKGKMLDHINRNKSDNRISNLRLVDSIGNAQNRRSYNGEGNPAAKLTREIVEQIRKAPGTTYERAARFGVGKSLVSLIDRKEVWQ